MTPKQAPPTRDSSDLSQGQMIIIMARWILVLAGLFLVLWDPGPLAELRFKLMFLLLLAGGNFYLIAQVLRRQPTTDLVVYLASLADIIVINAIVLSEGGFNSPTYIFYFPAILAISVAFPTIMLYAYTGSIMFIYSLIGLYSLLPGDFTAANLEVLAARLLMMAAIAVCGNLYWRLERNRRQAGYPSRSALGRLGDLDALSEP